MPPVGCEANCDGIAWLSVSVIPFFMLTMSITWCCCRRRKRYDSDNADDMNNAAVSTRQDVTGSTSTNNNSDVERAKGVKARIRAIEDGRGKTSMHHKPGPPRKQTPNNKAFEQFENSGIIIGMGVSGKRRLPHRDDDNDNGDGDGEEREQGVPRIQEPTGNTTRNTAEVRNEDDIFGDVTRNTQVLKSFRKAPPPRKKGRVTKAPQKLQPEHRTLAPEPAWVNPQLLHSDTAVVTPPVKASPVMSPRQTQNDVMDGVKRNPVCEGSPLWRTRELHVSQQRPISCDAVSTGTSSPSHKMRVQGRMQRYTASPKARRSHHNGTDYSHDHMEEGDCVGGIRKWQSERSSLHRETSTPPACQASMAKPENVQKFRKQYPMETEI